MHLTRLSLTNFRIFSRLELDFPRRVILFHGANAQGKTTILEAVSFMALFTSFSASSDRQLLNFNLPEAEPIKVGRIVGEFERGGRKNTLEVRLIQEPNGGNGSTRFRKEALLNGVNRRFSELYGQFNAVSFLPQMAKIFEGGPSDRRRYLDEILCQIEPGYSKHLLRYNQAMTRRNALLKRLGEFGGPPDQLDYWDGMLAEHGAHLMRGRISVLTQLEELARQSHEQLTQGGEILRLEYQPSFDPTRVLSGQIALPGVQRLAEASAIGTKEIETCFLIELIQHRKDDIMRGSTSSGPHRDELRFLANQVDLGDYGSRGQMRTALLSLKFAEVDLMKQRSGEWPVLLLDEVMAELDPVRRAALLGLLDKVEQAFVTTTDLEMFEPGFLAQHEVWKVQRGVVTKET
ncbi:MAG: DNA replication/repair protein RecF [Anaerolineaceae bacterium]|jgi:DNA replication and repair protein RecF|nr:DNA replication/repair protein RecF [Anaerolineaceae bacterium]MDD4042391.1 DNA replication/repair protein RecF [Anaerolineaceae bacterium]MDD4579026.1 DNA replication/repair protein RecF [Anaerolineaceae bacterium]